MIDGIKKHWFLWLMSAALAFGVGLVVNLPAAVVYDRFKPEIPAQIAAAVDDIDGSIWAGRGTVREGSLKTNIEWNIDLVDLIFGGTGLVLQLQESDHNLIAKMDFFGTDSGQIQLSGTINSSLVNQQLSAYGIRMGSDIQLEDLVVALSDNNFSEGSGSIEWKGGLVSYNSPNVKTIQMPELHGLLSVEEGALLLTIVEAGKSAAITMVSLKLDGWFAVKVKPAMAELILLPNSRVNRAGNVLEIKRKIF